MNPKQEFIKAIMQVLRLEANIYTMGAIEEIIDRLEVQDYTLFIAYLGERESDYEKPIESIAKGVNEFYELKISPIVRASKEKANMIISCMCSFFKDGNHQENIDSILNVSFILSENERFSISDDTWNIVKACKTFNDFKNNEFCYMYALEEEMCNSFIGKIKPNIEEKIENKSIDMAQKTLGICTKAIGLQKNKSDLI